MESPTRKLRAANNDPRNVSGAKERSAQLAQENGIVSHIVEFGRRHKMTHSLVTFIDGNLS